MIEGAGCKLEKLPPYSPDFNPIELSFSVIKKHVKNQYYIQSDIAPLAFARLVLKAGMECITPEIARAQFRHCRIHVIRDDEDE
jgi:transposase